MWLATDAGLFRLQPGSGRTAGGTGRGTAGPRLIPVAGNNQSALPGQELPTPLVVRLEDALGAPVVGTPLTATLLQGDAVFLSAPTAVTDAQGEARFRLRAGQSEADLVVEVATPALPEVAPVPFLAIIGGDAERRLHTLDPDTGAILTTVVITSDTGNTFVINALGSDARGTLLVTANTGGGSLSDLGRLDPATGVVTRLGPTGFGTLSGLVFDPTFRTLYTITGVQVPPALLALDPTTGQGTVIVQTNLPTQARSLAFTADGRLVTGGSDGNLYQVDPVTGAATLIGPSGVEEVSGMSLRVLR